MPNKIEYKWNDYSKTIKVTPPMVYRNGKFVDNPFKYISKSVRNKYFSCYLSLCEDLMEIRASKILNNAFKVGHLNANK